MTTKTLLTADTTNLVFKAFMNHLHENFIEKFGTQEFTYDVGSKFIRVWSVRGGSKSAYCFVERATGNVMKTATWRAPAKHPRGNLFDGIEDTKAYGVGMYGAAYLR